MKKRDPEDNDHGNSDNPARRKTSPSPTPLSGINNNSSNIHIDPSIADEPPSPPLLVTPPSPPKSHNMCYSPIAKRFSPPKLIQNASTGSLLDAIQCVQQPMPINDTAMLHNNSSTHSLYSHSQSSMPSKSCSATPCDANKIHSFVDDVDDITPDILDAAIASVERENDLYQVGQGNVNEDNISQSENLDGTRTPNNENELSQAQIDAMIESKYLKSK